MSFDPVLEAIKADPSLGLELQAAKTPRERAAILDSRGIAKPHADSEFPEMADVSGGGLIADAMGSSGAVYMGTWGL